MEWVIFGAICVVFIFAVWCKEAYNIGYENGHSMGLIDGASRK